MSMGGNQNDVAIEKLREVNMGFMVNSGI